MSKTPDGGDPYAERSLAQVLQAIATPGAGPAGGSAAAIGAALAASLVQLVAGVSRGWGDAAAVGRSATLLGQRLLGLADDDAAAWVDAHRHRDDADARLRARAVPLEIAAVALEVAELGRAAVANCAPHVMADAATAVHLAEGAREAALGVAAANEPG